MESKTLSSFALLLSTVSILMSLGMAMSAEAEQDITAKPTVTTVATIEATEVSTEATKEEATEAITEPTTEYIPEFPEAEYVWDRLRQAGYSEPVAAGVLGNMMAECGGQTLQLRPDVYSDDQCYYGICQWNKWNYQEVQGMPLDFQVEYLLDTIEREMGGRYESFLKMENPRDTAYFFASNYERCYEGTYGVRQNNAEIAMNYFGEDNND